MAVRDEYVDSATASGSSVVTLLRALYGDGAPIKALFSTFEVAAGDDDASIFRLFRTLKPGLR